MRAVRAVAFDFNGTLSHDEPILYAVYRDMFARHGRPLATHEWARSAEDVLRRRTTCSIRGLADAETRLRVERLLAGTLVV